MGSGQTPAMVWLLYSGRRGDHPTLTNRVTHKMTYEHLGPHVLDFRALRGGWRSEMLVP